MTGGDAILRAIDEIAGIMPMEIGGRRAPSGRARLSMLPIIQRTADLRGALMRKLDVLRAWKGGEADDPSRYRSVCLTIDGDRQDDAMLALLLPVIVRELEARVAQLDRDLASYGFEVG